MFYFYIEGSDFHKKKKPKLVCPNRHLVIKIELKKARQKFILNIIQSNIEIITFHASLRPRSSGKGLG